LSSRHSTPHRQERCNYSGLSKLDLLCVDANNLSARVAGRDGSYCRDKRFCRGYVQSIVDAIGTYLTFRLCRGERVAVPTGRGIGVEELVSFIKKFVRDTA